MRKDAGKIMEIPHYGGAGFQLVFGAAGGEIAVKLPGVHNRLEDFIRGAGSAAADFEFQVYGMSSCLHAAFTCYKYTTCQSR
jgi:hypothetical protein